MKKLFLTKTRWLVTIILLTALGIGQMWGYTYTRLESIAGIDANAVYVLGIDGTGFHYSGTSSWGLTALPANQTPYYYTLTPNNNNTSFTAQTKISNTTYYLQVPTSNIFSMSTSTGTNTTLIIGTTQSNAGNDKGYAVANSGTTTRHLRRNGTNGLRSYAGNTGALAFFYKVSCPNPTSLTNGEITSNTAHLSWTDAANTNKYEVYISTSSTAPGSNATPTATVTDQKYADITSGLSTSTPYNWWVRAKDKNNSAITSDWVAGTAFTTTSGASCAVDPTVSASSNGSVTCTSATITCNNGSSKGVVKGSCDISEWGFVYGTSGSPTGNKTSVGTNSSTDVANFSHTFTGLTPGQTYYFRAYAIVNGTTYYGSQTNFTCKTITVTANNGSYGSVSGSGLSWTATPNSGYVFADPAYTITAGNNTSVNKVGNTFTITSTSTVNVTITINFEAKNCTEHNSAALIAGTESSYTYGPVDPYYKYSTRQILYTKTDMNLGSTKKGSIKSIYFQYNHSTAISVKDDVKIYMANTNLTSLSKDDYVPYSAFTEVYSGAMNCTNGWNEITLNTPYEYNGVGSLVVMIDDNSGECHTNAFVFKYHSATGSQIYTSSDSNNENPETTDWSDYTPTNNRPNTKFCIEEKDMTISTVSFNTGTGNPTQANIAETSAGGGITLPAGPTPKCSADGWSFAGWSESAVASETTTAPTLLSAGSTYHPVSNTTLYAVYVKSEVAATATTTTYTLTGNWTTDNGNWTKIDGTDLSALASGKWGINSGSSTAVSPTSWTDIEKIDFTGSKSSSGSGTVEFLYGSGNSWTSISSQAVANSISWSPNPKVTGQLKCVFTRTNGNIYIASIAVKGKATVNTYFSNPECCNTLAAPANPGETPNSTGAVLTWDAVSGATGYEVKIDGGAWTSTGNGTTTGYTITGKACGGTSVSWQVRATGNGTTNCEKGAATTARNFTTTACACTNQYTYFWGTQITNDNPSSSAYASHHFECFNTWNSTEGKTGLITLPNSDTENYWFVGYNGNYYNSNLPGGGRSWCTAIADMNFANSQSDGKVLGWDGGYSYPRGATGYIRIYSDNTNSNKYAAFIPSGYILRWKNNRNSDAWTSYPFTDTGSNSYWETALVQLGADLSSDKVWVGLPTSGMSESFTWCGKSEEKNLIGVGKKTGASTWAANGIVAGDANQWGKWRIEITNNATNWNVHFVPYWKATYDVNGGGAISPTATNEGPVSCEGDATARQVTMPAAPSYAHHVFGGWKSSADNQVYNGGVTVSLSQNTTFTAQWTNSQYNITATLTNVTTETSFPVAYTYTGSAANVTYTFAASSGYRLPDNVTVTGSTYTWDKTTGELTLTGTITGNVSITISGTQTHNVTWMVNGVNVAAGQLGLTTNPVVYDDGGTLVLPSNPSVPSSCSGSKVFVGWTSDGEITSETSTKPTIISAGGAVNADATYRAVFAEGSGELDKFKRVTSVSDITAGSQVAIAFLVSSDLRLCSLDFNEWTTYSCATTVTETSSKINTPADAGVWNVSKSGDYWVFTNAGDGSTKLATSSSSSNQACDPETQTYYRWEIGSNSTGTNHFYIRLYDGSALTNCALELYQSTWKIYAPKSGDNYTYASNAYTALNLYVPDANYTNYITQCQTCVTPSDLAATNVTSSGAKITWSGISTLPTGGFKVAWSTSSTRPSPLNASNSADVAAGTNEYTITGLTKATKYYVWVQSKCNETWVGSINFTTLDYHTATFIGADGSTLQSGNVDEGAAITYSGSTPVTCDDGVDPSNYFVGWATNTWSGKVAKGSIVPTFYDIANGDNLPNMGGSDATFYAVFAKRSGTPLTENTYTGDFSSKKFSSSNNTSATVNGISWTLDAYHYDNEWNQVFCTDFSTGNNSRGQKVGSSSNWPAFMSLTTSGISGTITSVAVSTAGNSGVNATVAVSVGSSGWKLKNTNNYSASLTNSNTAYEFTGSGTGSISIDWAEDEENYTDALYFSQIVVAYTTGGDISYSNYMTSCATCVTPTSVAASDITESGATITWSGTSASGTEGFKVAWNTANSVPSPLTGSNSADVAKNVKTYDITGLNSGTTYYVFVQSKCNGEWSSSTNFTTLAVHDITFTKDNGTLSVVSPVGVVDGQTLTFPNVTSTSCGTFVGWKAAEVSDYDNVAAPSPLYKYNDTKENITADESYQAVYRTASGAETNVTDNWTGTKIGVSIYSDWTGKTDATAAVYAGNTTKNSDYSNCIQLRNGDNCGIVTTASGGLAKKVTITWNSNTTNGKVLDIYGKNTAYSSAADLYNNENKGTLLGSITKGTTTELTIAGDYAYIGMRCSDNGARYIDNIAIQWYGTPMSYMTAPTCNAMVGITASLSQFTYVYGSGPSAAQSFTVSGINLSAPLIVTAPANYKVCKTADGTYESSVSFTAVAGKVSAQTVYILLAAGLNVGTYNYAAASGVSVSSTGATAQTAALNGSVTKATGTFVWTDFNAVDHYEGEIEKGASNVAIPYNYTYTGDGTVSLVRGGGYGSVQLDAMTYTLSNPGTYTLTANASGGTNYTNPTGVVAEFRVKRVDTYVDFIHNKTIKEYSGGAIVVDGKMNDWGSGYTVPKIDDNAEETSGSCQQTHFKFIGWVSEDDINIADGTFKSGYTIVTAGTTEKAATSKTYYAIWAKLEE